MKKFFTNIPHQGPGQLQRYRYQPVDNPHLEMDEDCSFPILTAINGYAQTGEQIRVIAVTTALPSDSRNAQAFQEDVADLCRRKGIELPNGVEFINAEDNERVSAQTDTFLKLIECVEDQDELYSCLTFGTKPQSFVLQMAIQYAYRIQKNTSIGCIVYGKVNRGEHGESSAQVYDMTLLTRLDELVRLLADKRVTDPKEIIRMVLSD